MSDLTLVVDNGAEVREEALTWPEKARALKVTDNDTYTLAAGMVQGIKALRQRIAEVFDPHIQRAHQAHKALVAEKAQAEAPLTEAEGIIKRGLVDYTLAQERIRLAEQRRLETEARKREEERRLAEAAALETAARATGDADMLAEAQELIAAPVETPTVIVPKATPKIAGISFRESWHATVRDKMALIKFVAANPNYATLLDANMPALNQLARSLKTGMNIPGVRADSDTGAAASAR